MITKHIINILRITPAIVPSPFGANSLIIIINRFLEVVNCLHSLLGANLSILVRFCNDKYNFQFPCPSGVFIFSIVNALDKYFELTLLPSPSGVSIFSITRRVIYAIFNEFPSPSGVSIFSIFWRCFMTNISYEFPSPSGVSIFSINIPSYHKVIGGYGFRPLPGFLSSQLIK